MCGVVAVLRRGARPLPEAVVLRAMAAAIVHRGPDDFGFYRDDDVMLGAVRLAIVDPAGGAQPHRGCRRASDPVVAVANGEIYNHRELRSSLRDHELASGCDTSVIPHLYEERGEDFVLALRGMFALAVWDRRQRTLLLARDRLGIKPLFYAETRDYLVVASEAKAILAAGRAGIEALSDPRVDRDALDDLFSMGYPCPPRTMFEGIRELRPAHVAVARVGRPLAMRRYWRAPFVPRAEQPRGRLSSRTLKTHAEEARAVLLAAAGDHLMSDVPVAAMLSGGLDSSAVAALAGRAGGRPLTTFALGFDDADAARFDERRYARSVAERLGGPHVEVPLTRASAELLPEMIWALELPLIVPGAIGGLALAEAERAAGFRVALSGDGADELLGGYDVFRASKLKRRLMGWGLSALEPALVASAALLAGQPRGIAAAIRPRGPLSAIHEIQDAWGGLVPPWLGSWLLLDHGARKHLLSPDGRAVRPVLEPPAGFSALIRDDLGALDPLDAEIALELETRLPSWILVISDRSSMARGIEARVPLLDDRVVEMLLKQPPEAKMRGFREKAVLRAAVADLLPPAVAWRRKKPFMTPVAPWFFDPSAAAPVRALVEDALSPGALRDTGLFQPGAVARLRSELAASPTGGVARFQRELILMLVLGSQILARQFVLGVGVPSARFTFPSSGDGRAE